MGASAIESDMKPQPATSPVTSAPDGSAGGIVAVVLAGGDRGDSLAASGGVAAKALLPVAGQPMGAYVLRALRDCEAVSRIVYVGPTEGRLSGLIDTELASGERLVDSLALGLGAALGAGAQSVLVLSADVPWITGAMVTRFLAACAAAGPADVYYPVVREQAYRARFPDHRRTYVKLREGRVTGGNLALLTPGGATAVLPLIDRVFRSRKNPFSLAAIMGFDVLASLLLGSASLPRLERRAAALLGRPGRVVVSQDPELAADVDQPTHMPGVLGEEQPFAPPEETLEGARSALDQRPGSVAPPTGGAQ